MGCDMSTTKSIIPEDDQIEYLKTQEDDIHEPIDMLEHSMRFYRCTIDQINIAFFHHTMDNIITRKQIERSLSILNLDMYEEKNKIVYELFFNSFDYEKDQYDLIQILTSLYLFSKNTMNQKALALFSLYHPDSNENLTDYEIQTTIHRICECVFDFTVNLLKIDPEMKIIHEDDLKKVIEKIISDAISYMKPNDNLDDFVINEQKFIELINTIYQQRNIDLTLPQSIRKHLMRFLFEKQTRVLSKRKSRWSELSHTHLQNSYTTNENTPSEKNHNDSTEFNSNMPNTNGGQSAFALLNHEGFVFTKETSEENNSITVHE